MNNTKNCSQDTSTDIYNITYMFDKQDLAKCHKSIS